MGKIFVFTKMNVRGLLKGQSIKTYKDEISGKIFNELDEFEDIEELQDRIEQLVDSIDKTLEQHDYTMENDQLSIFGIAMSYELLESTWSSLITGLAGIVQAQL